MIKYVEKGLFFYWKRIRRTFKRFSATIVSLKLRAHQEERAEYYWIYELYI